MEEELNQKVFTAPFNVHDEGPRHIETILLICSVNQSTGFFMMGTYIMKELMPQ